MMNETHPTWTCPVCSKLIQQEELIIDEYFADLMNFASSSGKSIENVEISAEGTWNLQESPETSSGESSDSEDEGPPRKKIMLESNKDSQGALIVAFSESTRDTYLICLNRYKPQSARSNRFNTERRGRSAFKPNIRNGDNAKQQGNFQNRQSAADCITAKSVNIQYTAIIFEYRTWRVNSNFTVVFRFPPRNASNAILSFSKQ
jgi:hypothetical protein